jgi:membrane associated rhomboid family serine protease
MRYNVQMPLSGVVRHLIILNVFMFIGTYILLGTEQIDPEGNGYLDLGRLQLAAFLPGTAHFQPWQMITHMFMHGNIMHIAFNMLGLYFFGSMVEMIWGAQRFLFYYMFCGIGAWALHLGVQWWELKSMGIDPLMWNAPMLGASGAVFGIMVAFAFNFPEQEIRLMFPPVAMRAKYFVPIMAVLELIYGVQGFSTGIAHFAHLGGALFGFLLILFWGKGRLR